MYYGFFTKKKTIRNTPASKNVTKVSREETMRTISTDFSRTAANIAGLVSLLEPEGSIDPDYKDIRHYLAIESTKLLTLVKAICI